MRSKAIFGLILLMCGLAVFGTNYGTTAMSKSNPVVNKTVTISNFQFAPKTVTVKAGSTVTWVNKDGTHTVTADNGSFQSPSLTAGKSFSHKFTKPGTYRYYCSFHGGAGGADMSGIVTVTK